MASGRMVGSVWPSASNFGCNNSEPRCIRRYSPMTLNPAGHTLRIGNERNSRQPGGFNERTQ